MTTTNSNIDSVIKVGETQPTHRDARKRAGLPAVHANTIAAERKAGRLVQFFADDGVSMMMRRVA